jgi:hypothetical protein
MLSRHHDRIKALQHGQQAERRFSYMHLVKLKRLAKSGFNAIQIAIVSMQFRIYEIFLLHFIMAILAF